MCTGAEIALLASFAVAAVGSIQQGNAADSQARAQAEVQRQQAERERLQAEADATEFRDDQQRLMARRRAILGGSGVVGSTGSPLLASEDFIGETTYQALKIKSGGEVRSTRLKQQANLTLAKGRSDRTAGFYRGGASLLKGLGQVNWS